MLTISQVVICNFQFAIYNSKIAIYTLQIAIYNLQIAIGYSLFAKDTSSSPPPYPAISQVASLIFYFPHPAFKTNQNLRNFDILKISYFLFFACIAGFAPSSSFDPF